MKPRVWPRSGSGLVSVRLARGLALGVVVVGLVLALAAGSAVTSAGAASPGLAFGHAVVVDHQRVTGEPSLSISPTLNTRRRASSGSLRTVGRPSIWSVTRHHRSASRR
ncbi:MAG: hypothetical protein E6G03_02575 [Actinobacteria bacterium]|nr:MAG: hypothetical protein E6G03_02575 [Actinomycetota bacterium]